MCPYKNKHLEQHEQAEHQDEADIQNKNVFLDKANQNHYAVLFTYTFS